jgi:small ligand-binding sensory domain FIST
LAIKEVTRGLRDAVADLVVAFLGGAYGPMADAIGARIRQALAPRVLIGTTAGGVVADDTEIEHARSLALWGVSLRDVELTALEYPPPAEGSGTPAGAGLGWSPPPADARALLLFADPWSFPADAFLAWLEQARPGLPVTGGIASGADVPRQNRLLLNERVLDGGAVGVALGGNVRLRMLVSQGCRPIGNTYVVTRADRNLLRELGGEPPIDRIRETFAQAGPSERELMRAGLHIGTVIDEYRDEFRRGDFLVRGVLGAEPGTGAIAVGDVVRVGQTVRFHVRDADSADADLRELLDDFAATGPPAAAALLFTCNGRGSRLFGVPNHDAELVRGVLGGVPLAGFFCAGEFGPVGARSFLHGFTASLLVVDDP